LPRVVLCASHVESHTVSNALPFGRSASAFDGLIVIIESEEMGLGECLRHQDRGRALPATHIGNSRSRLELFLYAVESGYPCAHEIGRIAGTEKLLASVENALIVLVPTHSGARPEGLSNARNCNERPPGELKCSGQICGAVLVG